MREYAVAVQIFVHEEDKECSQIQHFSQTLKEEP